MIVKIDEIWYEIWCPFCGVNAGKSKKVHGVGNAENTPASHYRIQFLGGVPGLTKHLLGRHRDVLSIPDGGAFKDGDTLQICGKAVMYQEEMEDLVEGKKVPMRVHIAKEVESEVLDMIRLEMGQGPEDVEEWPKDDDGDDVDVM